MAFWLNLGHDNSLWERYEQGLGGLAAMFAAMSTPTGPRAVGQACGNNPIPIVVPCHRVVSKTGLGGFMHSSENTTLDIKRWLLAHEQH